MHCGDLRRAHRAQGRGHSSQRGQPQPAKVGSDIHDLARLVQHSDIGPAADEIAAHSEKLRKWMAATLLKWFSAGQNLQYSHARFADFTNRPTPRTSPQDDLASVAELGHAIFTTQP